MTYNPRPNPSGDTLVLSRDPIRTNFEVIQSRFEDNHAEFGTGEGKHTIIDLVEQTTFPATAANESWASSRAYNARTELVWRPESQAAGEQAVGADQFVLSAMPIRAAATFIIATGVPLQVLVGRSFNITSITRSSSTRYDVIMDLPAPSADYWLLGQTQRVNGSSPNSVSINYSSVPATTTTFQLRPNSETNGDRLSFIIYGG